MKKLIFRLILFVFFSFLFYSIYSGCRIKNKIEESGVISIGRFVDYDHWGKGETNYFKHYVGSHSFKGNGGRAPDEFQKNIGKFYRIKFVKASPENLKAFFDQEITDTAAILEAGFPIEEVRKRLRNQHK